MTNDPEYTINIEIKLSDFDIKYKKGDAPNGSPPNSDEQELISYESEIFYIGDDGKEDKITNEEMKKALLDIIVDEEEVLQKIVPLLEHES